MSRGRRDGYNQATKLQWPKPSSAVAVTGGTPGGAMKTILNPTCAMSRGAGQFFHAGRKPAIVVHGEVSLASRRLASARPLGTRNDRLQACKLTTSSAGRMQNVSFLWEQHTMLPDCSRVEAKLDEPEKAIEADPRYAKPLRWECS